MLAQIKQGLNVPFTSSCGRLFDAVSALLGIRGLAGYEAQAAIEMETISTDVNGAFSFDITTDDNLSTIELAPALQEMVVGIQNNVTKAELAGRFHNTVVAFTIEMCRRLSLATGIKKIALSGGVFQNRRLFRQMNRALLNAGFDVLTHCQVPCNDGGLSLGQAVVASYTR
jgi:hydrogenase maturation protein HypF